MWLDIDSQDLSEYEGKQLEINNAVYSLGALLGYGNDAFVFPLINRKSNTCLQVFKLQRVQSGTLTDRVNLSKLIQGAASQIVLVAREYNKYNGFFQVQEYCGPEICSGGEYDQMTLGNLEFKRENFSEAARKYNSALEINSNNVVVLNNMAATLMRLDEKEKAYEAMRLATCIEPNCLEYYKNTLKIGSASCVSPRQLVAIAREMRSNIDYLLDEEACELATGLFLMSGNPETAQEMVELVPWKDNERIDQLQEFIEEHVRNKSTATENTSFLNSSKSDAPNDGGVSSLKCSIDTYEYDPYVNVNLGIHHLWRNEFDEARGFLSNALPWLSMYHRPHVFLHLSFVYILKQQYTQAATLLNAVADDLAIDLDLDEISYPDLPFATKQICRDGVVLEYLPQKTIKLLNKFELNYDEEKSDQLVKLLNAYDLSPVWSLT